MLLFDGSTDQRSTTHRNKDIDGSKSGHVYVINVWLILLCLLYMT